MTAAQHNPLNSAIATEQQLQQAKAAAAKAKRKYRFLSRLVDKRVQKQQNKQLAARASKAEREWKAGRYAAFYKTVSRLFKDAPAKAGSQGLLSKDGQSLYRSPEEQLKRFTEYFAEVFSGDCVSPEQQELMEGMIARLEHTMNGCVTGQQPCRQQQRQR